jgi:uncharacterized membrane protein YraQ (UPF0718 family)
LNPPRPASRLASEWKTLVGGVLGFVLLFAMPVQWPRFNQAVGEALALTHWYAQEHVLLCLLPAFFIAGAIGAFVSQNSVMKYLGPAAPRPLAYGVASVSGTILSVCSCTVLPLFAGIWRMGAGLGPAIAFLYSGPAISVLAIVLTAAVLGPEMGLARAIGAITFSVVIGAVMHLIYRKEEAQKVARAQTMPAPGGGRPLWQTAGLFAAMVGILVFANWSAPTQTDGLWRAIWSMKWVITSAFALILAVMLVAWMQVAWWKMAMVIVATVLSWILARFVLLPRCEAWLPGHENGLPYEAMIPFAVSLTGLALVLSVGRRSDDANDWMEQSWDFAKLITPLLIAGVLIAGLLLGRPGQEGLIPSQWVAAWVGGNSLGANLLASVIGAFMYFATLTEVPIVQGLVGSGMGKGPALALLLAGPALSLPNMLVLRSIMGLQKTLVYVALVVVMSTLSGWAYGCWF